MKEGLVSLLREEEIKWYERAKAKTLLYGDDNTRFFHIVANGKHSKQHIFILDQEDGVIIGADSRVSMGTYISNRASDKLTPLGENVWMARSGSAADAQVISDYGKTLVIPQRPDF